MNTETVQQPSSVNEAKRKAGLAASGWLGRCPKCQQASLLCDNQPQERYPDMTNVWCALCDYKGAIKRLVRGASQPKSEQAQSLGRNAQPE
jgi:hypothetical protein